MRLLLKEHCIQLVSKNQEVSDADIWKEEVFDKLTEGKRRIFKIDRGKEVYPYIIDKKDEEIYTFQADYYVGIDWLIEDEKFIHVEPKINKVVTDAFKELLDIDEDDQSTISDKEDAVEKEVGEIGKVSKTNHREIDFLKMLLEVYSGQVEEKYLKDIVTIYWDEKRIPIEQHQDQLTPFLIVQFLQLLKKIVRKGLKKSYYKVQENLNGHVKGKILIGKQLKQNVFKNRLTSTICEYQVFGVDSVENRFLKKVLRFVSSYVDNHPMLFNSNQQDVKNLISYCRPAFELVGEDVEIHQLKHLKANPFFKEYKEAIKIGQYILKRFAYNITHTTEQKVETPPFWIDMPRLFELYVYHQLRKANPERKGDLHYQFSTYGNALDLLITYNKQPIVVDMKYKLHYKHGHIHEDIRQVSGYARLKRVRDECNVTDDSNINCLVIYPKVENADLVDYSLDNISKLLNEDNMIKPYYKVFKLGVELPWIN